MGILTRIDTYRREGQHVCAEAHTHRYGRSQGVAASQQST